MLAFKVHFSSIEYTVLVKYIKVCTVHLYSVLVIIEKVVVVNITHSQGFNRRRQRNGDKFRDQQEQEREHLTRGKQQRVDNHLRAQRPPQFLRVLNDGARFIAPSKT